MNRQFIAVVPDGLKANPELKTLMGKLKRTTSDREQDVRWVPPDLWHVTLRFMGDLADRGPKLRELFDRLDLGAASESITLRMQGVGAFPSAEEGRVLWLGVHEDQAFLDLQARLEEQLRTEGFEASDREFNPHLTIGRFRNTANLTDLVKLGGRKHFGDYVVSELVLFESVLVNHIHKYNPIARRPWAGPANSN